MECCQPPGASSTTESVTAGVSSKQASGVLKPGAKGQRRPDQGLLDALTELRESGQIPWDAIVDETRSFDDFTGSATIADDLSAYIYATRIDLGSAMRR